MDTYSILRNNKERGPFTLKELSSHGLFATDLIWVEGQSAAWRTPLEIDELKTLVQSPEAANTIKTTATSEAITQENTAKQNAVKPSASIFVSKPVNATEKEGLFAASYLKETAMLYEENKQRKGRKKQFALGYNALALTLLFIGAVAGAFIMKQMISSFGNERSVSIGEAKEIDSQNIPVSTSTHTAEASLKTTGNQSDVSVSATKDLGSTKVKPTSKVAAAAFTATTNNKSVSDQEAEGSPGLMQNAPSPLESKVQNEEDKKTDQELKPPTIARNAIELSANDYKVGLLGGVSGLQLSVTNPTSQNIENLLVEVEFLKPNGTVVKTEILSVPTISAGASKSIAVPSSNRGVKIRYRVISRDTNKETIATDNM